MYHKGGIESAPLQAYVSALVFSPRQSVIQNIFKREAPPWLTIIPAMTGACLQTLEGHSDYVRSVVFSHDSTRLASASDDITVKIWDAGSGDCLQTLDIGKALSDISFHATDSCLHTEIGAIVISASAISSNTTAVTKPQHPQY
jgi:WD40 repeat protein